MKVSDVILIARKVYDLAQNIGRRFVPDPQTLLAVGLSEAEIGVVVAALRPEMKSLARHALGLPNDRKMSYRNYFSAGRGHADYSDWEAMVGAGLARRRDGKNLPFGGDDMFHLTLVGAWAALEPGERLDSEDFPGR